MMSFIHTLFARSVKPAVLAICLATAFPVSAQSAVLLLEAENATEVFGSGWSVETSLTGFSGAGYIVWRGENDFRTSDDSPPVGINAYDFVVTQPGTYAFSARVQARAGNGNAAGDQDNDAWVKFTSGSATNGIRGDSAKWTKFYVGGNDENWKPYSSGEQYDPTFFTRIQRDLPAGTHRILVGGRSTRFAIDNVALELVNASLGTASAVEAPPQTPPQPAVPAPPSVPEQPVSQTPTGSPADPITQPPASNAACTASGGSLVNAVITFAQSCPNIRRIDCDPIENGQWLCSSAIIGNAAPGLSRPNAGTPTAAPSPVTPTDTGCQADGSTLGQAAAQYAASCPGIPRRDCDPISRGLWRCSSEIIGSSGPGAIRQAPRPQTVTRGELFSGNDLLALHYDNCPDPDDGHAAAAGKSVLGTVGIENVIVVNGTCGFAIRNRYQPGSEAVMNAIWGSMWLDSYNQEESAINTAALRWATTLSNGDDVWVAEGGPSDFTARVLQRIGSDYPSVNRKRIHVVQHSAGTMFNEANTSPNNMAFVKQVADYRTIPNGNRPNNGSAGFNTPSAFFVNTALQSRFAAEWDAAFNYLNPNTKLDFSDTVELLYIIGDTQTAGPDDFAIRYLK
ncbi:MAG: hypothetical protein AB8B63_23180 [Granulosicoccus sp.]